MGVNDYVFAIHIHGMRHPTDTTNANPIVLSTGLLPSLGSVVSALSSAEVLPILSSQNISGYNWDCDPRKVIATGGKCVVKFDDLNGEWGSQLLKTQRGTTWDIEASTFTSGTTSIKIKGKTGLYPTRNNIYWIEREAIQIDDVPVETASGATLTITRGVCGSRAVRHRIDPMNYYAGSDGSNYRMKLTSAPDWGHRFFAQIFLFRLDQFGAVSSQYLSRYAYVESVTPLVGRQWEISLGDIGGLLSQHKHGHKAHTVSLSHRIRATQFMPVTQNNDSNLGIPQKAEFYMTRLEAELFAREPIHHTGLGTPDQTLTNALGANLQSTLDTRSWYIEVDASGRWLYEITSLFYRDVQPAGQLSTTGATLPYAVFTGSLIDREPGKGVFGGGAGSSTQELTLVDGWSGLQAAKVGLQKPGEKPPTVTLRCVIHDTPINAFLQLTCNDDAGLVGHISPELPLDWFQVGSTGASVPLIDPGTVDLAKRNQLLTAVYQYALSLKDDRTLASFLAEDLCLPHSLMLGPVATSGKFTLRPWVRDSSIYSPVTLPTESLYEVAPGSTLPRVTTLRLESGFRQLDLTPDVIREFQTEDAKQGDQSQRARIWLAGNQSLAQSLASGALSSLVRGFLELYGGAPIVYQVPVSVQFILENGVQFLDFVDWSNDDVLSENGTGVSGTFLLIGMSIEWRTGRVICRLAQDNFNSGEVTIPSPATVPAPKPPAIKVTRNPVTTAVAGTYRVPVEVVGAPATNIADIESGIISDVIVGSVVRMFSTAQVDQAAETQEREGFLEAYGTVSSIEFDEGSKQNYLNIAVDTAWDRGTTDFVKQNILVPNDGVILFTDERSAASNLQGTNIEPTAAQLYNGGGGSNFVKVSGDKPFDRAATRVKSV